MIDVTLLGTAATMPLPDRALSSVLVRYSGRTILFDCGEGTQTAARKAGVSLMKTDLIALTHFHGDHIFGLPGLLQSFGCLGRTDPLYLTGPEGLPAALEPILRLAGKLPYSIYYSPVPEEGLAFGDAVLKAFPVNHRVSACGYRLELRRAGKFDPEKADRFGVPVSCRSRLQHGESVTVGCNVITPEQVLGPERKGLRLVISGDTAPCEALTEAAAGADLLICDATYGSDDCEQDAAEYGHSTFSQAARTAAEAGVRKLWLTHFSQMMEDPCEFLSRATDLFPDTVCGFDGMSATLKFEENITC